MTLPLVIIQSRLGSLRLPNKALKPLLDSPTLFYTVERLKALRTPVRILLATTLKKKDDLLEQFTKAYGIECFRGSSEHVLERFYRAALKIPSEIIVRITGDCPLVQTSLLDKMLQFFISSKGEYDYVSNVHPRSYPKGMDLEIFTWKALEKAYLNAKNLYEIEHVTPYFYQNRDLFSLYNFKSLEDLSSINVSIDTLEDFEFVRSIFEKHYPINPLFELSEIREMLLESKLKKA